MMKKMLKRLIICGAALTIAKSLCGTNRKYKRASDKSYVGKMNMKEGSIK